MVHTGMPSFTPMGPPSGAQSAQSHLVPVVIFVVLQSPPDSASPIPEPTPFTSQHLTPSLLPTQIFTTPPHLRFLALLLILTPPLHTYPQHLCLLLCSRLLLPFSIFNCVSPSPLCAVSNLVCPSGPRLLQPPSASEPQALTCAMSTATPRVPSFSVRSLLP